MTTKHWLRWGIPAVIVAIASYLIASGVATNRKADEAKSTIPSVIEVAPTTLGVSMSPTTPTTSTSAEPPTSQSATPTSTASTSTRSSTTTKSSKSPTQVAKTTTSPATTQPPMQSTSTSLPSVLPAAPKRFSLSIPGVINANRMCVEQMPFADTLLLPKYGKPGCSDDPQGDTIKYPFDRVYWVSTQLGGPAGSDTVGSTYILGHAWDQTLDPDYPFSELSKFVQKDRQDQGRTPVRVSGCSGQCQPAVVPTPVLNGKKVTIETANARLVYTITETFSVRKEDISKVDSVWDSTAKNRLVIVTCAVEGDTSIDDNVVIYATLSAVTPL